MSSEDTEKDGYIGFDVESELKQKARRAAKRDGRSLSNYMRRVLRIALAAEEDFYGSTETRREHAPVA